MKTTTVKLKGILVSLLVLVCYSQQVEAQFLKRLQKRVEKSAEEAVIRKAEKKTAQTVDKSVDKIFDVNFSKESIDPSVLPASYDFEWKYKLQMKTKKGTFDMTYFLKPNAKYFGSKPEFKEKRRGMDMFMVMDQDIEAITLFMNSDGKKSGHIMPSISKEAIDNAENEQLTKDMNYKKLGTKTILGYKCQGFQIENKDTKMTMYVALNAPVSFNQVYGGTNKDALPKGFDPKWLKGTDNNGLMMELIYVNKKNKKHNATMTCLELTKEAHTITTGDYEFINLKKAQPQR